MGISPGSSPLFQRAHLTHFPREIGLDESVDQGYVTDSSNCVHAEMEGSVGQRPSLSVSRRWWHVVVRHRFRGLARGKFATALALGLSAGCAELVYVPPRPPDFMRAEVEADRPKSVDNVAKPSETAKPAEPVTPPLASESAEKPSTATSISLSWSNGITLDQAILETLNNDPKLRAGIELIAQANADFWTSSLLPNPTFLPDLLLLPRRPFTAERPGGPPQADYLVAYPVDWFLFGKRAAAMNNARLGVDVTAADYADLVRQRVANTIASYYDVLLAKAQLGLSRQYYSSLRRVEEITKDRVRFGGAGAIEVDRIRVAVLSALRDVHLQETTLATAKVRLQAAMGRNVEDPAFDVSGTLESPQPAEPIDLSSVLALAEENRPDVVSLRRQIVKAEAAVEVERTKAYPAVQPQFGVTHQYQGHINAPDTDSYNFYLSVGLPLFDRNQGNINKARSVLTQTHQNLLAQLVQVRAELAQVVQEYRDAHELVTKINPEHVKNAKSVQERIEAAYKDRAGGKTLLDVLDAQRAYLDAYKMVIMSQSDYWHALYRLNAVVGKQVLK
jgi:outer membrane protein, heavy metal efflux system